MSNKISQASLTFGAAFAVHELNLSTGTGARAISGIHRHLGLTSDELPGQEGSFGEYEGLEPGIYEIGFWLETQEREPNSRDILYVYNKRSSPILIGDTIAAMGNLTGLYEKLQHTTIEIEVPYGYLALILVDETSKAGTTIAHIESLKRTADLPYPVPIVYSNEPTNAIGSTGYNHPYAWANTGTGAKAASTLDEFMGWSDPVIRQGIQGLIPTVGSIISFNVLPGLYKIVLELVSSESNVERDGFFIWNGSELSLGGRRILADKPLTSTRFTSGIKSIEKVVYSGKINLAFIPFDTESTTGTTEIRIHRIERIGSASMNSYPAHTEIIDTPFMMAVTALNSFRNANNIITNQPIPEALPYTLDSWNEYFWKGYNWYWHHISPSGEDSSLLNQEAHNFSLLQALNEFEFQEEFAKIIGEAGLITLKVFNYNLNAGNSTNLSQEQYAFQVILGLYKLAAKIGQFNNTENALLSNHIPQAFSLMRDYLSQLNSMNALPGVIRVFELMRDDAYIPLAFSDNYNLIESLWIESLGLD